MVALTSIGLGYLTTLFFIRRHYNNSDEEAPNEEAPDINPDQELLDANPMKRAKLIKKLNEGPDNKK